MDLLLNINWTDLLNPEFYISHGGIWLLLFIVYAETGLMFGFFLPGDSLIFIAGIYSQKLIKSVIPAGLGSDFLNLLLLIVLLSACGILGNMTGYWFGKKSGSYLYKKKDSLFFKRKYLDQTKNFFDQYGSQTIVFARFLPTIRTFAPIVAGIVSMDRSKFMAYNVLGCLLWIITMAMSGHYLDKYFIDQWGIDIKEHLEVIVIGLIIVTTIPFVWKYFNRKKI